MAERIHLVSAAVVYKKDGRDTLWFLVREKEDGDWEIPKTVARGGESSVRAAIRMLGEQGGMRVKVLEEVGRHGGAARVGERIVTQRTIYYLIAHKEGQEILGFIEAEWVEHSAALRRVGTKLDREMLKDARALLSEIREKKRKKREAEKAAAKLLN
jgi:ADP-ribose pyrophosphatase YjhB (NUDIX family)